MAMQMPTIAAVATLVGGGGGGARTRPTTAGPGAGTTTTAVAPGPGFDLVVLVRMLAATTPAELLAIAGMDEAALLARWRAWVGERAR